MRKKTQPRNVSVAGALPASSLAAIRGGNDITSGTTEEAAPARTKYSNITLKRG